MISNDLSKAKEARWTLQEENIIAELQKIARRSELLAADDTNHLSDIKFDQDYRYMTIQAITTIEIMGQAISTQIKGNLIVVNMIHTIVLRLYLLLDDNVKSEDYKPDLVSFYNQRNKRFDLVVAENKPRVNLSYCLPSDSVKLGQQMKVMMNRLVACHIPNPTAGSLCIL
ncbi:hypothetical protein G6F42_015707 [Rhizopus arrhizus]|nr:hypothetical protein G6F42_015707 [Rhizopus arrhizus]